MAGFVAGLFGVGGGVVMVPILYWVLGSMTQVVPTNYVMHMALATSLATIFVTALSSVRAHHQRGAVQWYWVRCMAPGLVVGSLIGTQIANWLNTEILRTLFGVFEILLGLTMLRPKRGDAGPADQASNINVSPIVMVVLAGFIGKVSALAGIGGGTLSVPLLHKFGMRMQYAVATSAACGVPIALAATLGYIVSGQSVTELPEASIGYVYLPAMLTLIVGSVLVAPLGARLAHAISPGQLRFWFSILLIVMGINMLLGDFLSSLV